MCFVVCVPEMILSCNTIYGLVGTQIHIKSRGKTFIGMNSNIDTRHADRHHRHATTFVLFFCSSFSLDAFEGRGLAIFIQGSFPSFSMMLGHFTAHFIVDRQWAY